VEFNLGRYLTTLKVVTDDLQRRNVVNRIWRKDHTVWNPDPTEIANRLGWLTITDSMRGQLSELESLAQEIRQADFRHVVLLGMGGSSLGAKVLGQTFGTTTGYPKLIVLDSTVPAQVKAVGEAIDPSRTLFVVSSKSGTTIESACFSHYFLLQVESLLGKEKSRQNFIAITDPGTPLARQAEREKFRRVFTNPPDIGGRYSVLSYFGLVPAILTGVNITELLDRADLMRGECVPNVPVTENTGAWLGAVMATLARQGRDKLTLVTSPNISSFGLWVEQLIAESMGKDGQGIVPVIDEPLIEPHSYGEDRFFVYLRLQDDNNLSMDDAIERFKFSGQPVIILKLRDKYDLGAEFFRWEFATTVAGAILGIHPFNQPDVQSAKEATEQMLREFTELGYMPQPKVSHSLTDLLKKAKQGMYLAVTAYIQQTYDSDRHLENLRRKIIKRYPIATTLGYGPRYLHSTGQLHKGGPATGLFLQITTLHEKDIPIPRKPYTFGVLADAQALGDLRTLLSMGRPVTKVCLRQDELNEIHDWLED
jgi:glucose-6-phosphate isomerase/transaldolase/glucose-6-phosphate isomerase